MLTRAERELVRLQEEITIHHWLWSNANLGAAWDAMEGMISSRDLSLPELIVYHNLGTRNVLLSQTGEAMACVGAENPELSALCAHMGLWCHKHHRQHELDSMTHYCPECMEEAIL